MPWGDGHFAYISGNNKREVASVLAEQFLALLSKLPPRRKCWQSEDYRMSIFDAAAAGVAYFGRYQKRMPNGSGDITCDAKNQLG